MRVRTVDLRTVCVYVCVCVCVVCALQVSVLLTSSWPFFPDLLGMVEVAASQVAAVMGAAAAQPQPQQLQLPAPASNPPLA